MSTNSTPTLRQLCRALRRELTKQIVSLQSELKGIRKTERANLPPDLERQTIETYTTVLRSLSAARAGRLELVDKKPHA